MSRAFVAFFVLMILSDGPAARVSEKPSPIDVFVGGREGYFSYRIPSLITSPRGTLLAFCEGRKTSRSDVGNNDLLLRRSADNGRTWQKTQLIYEEGGDAVIAIGNPCAVVDPATGRIWLSMNRKSGRVLLTYSDDDGATWATVRDITSQASRPAWGWYSMGPGVGIALKRGPHRGRLILPANHRETPDRSGPSTSHIIYSDDHGRTWNIGGSVGLHTNECQLVETLADDGAGSELLINMRNHWEKSGNRPDLAGNRLVSRSRDDGQTWSEPVRDETLIEPRCQASLMRFSWPGGLEKSVLLFANPASATQSKRQRMTVRLSYDEGHTWPLSKLIDAGSSGYCCLARLKDGQVGLMYETDKLTLKFVSFPLNWLIKP